MTWEVRAQVIQNDKLPHCNDRPTIPSGVFSITSMDGLTAEAVNHALRHRALSGSMMAPSIPVILRILPSSTRAPGACGP